MSLVDMHKKAFIVLQSAPAKELAAYLNVSERQVNHWRKGTRPIGMPNAIKIVEWGKKAAKE